MYLWTYCSERFGSRTIASEENYPLPNLKTNPKPNSNPNRGGFSLGENCPDTERFVNKRSEKWD